MEQREMIKEAVIDMGYRTIAVQDILYWLPGCGFVLELIPGENPEVVEITDKEQAINLMVDLIQEKLETTDTLVIYECRDNQELFIEGDQTVDENVLEYFTCFEIGNKKVYVGFD
jgi:hypothetical protein